MDIGATFVGGGNWRQHSTPLHGKYDVHYKVGDDDITVVAVYGNKVVANSFLQ